MVKQSRLISAADRNDPSAGRLMVADASTGALREDPPRIPEGRCARSPGPMPTRWSTSATKGSGRSLAEVDLDGTRRTVPAGNQPNFGDLSLSSDGSAIGIRGELPVASRPRSFTGGGAEISTARRQQSAAGDLPLAPQEVIRYKARDGLEIEGLLIRPLNEKKGTRYPLIVTVHGGPEAHYRNEWLTSYSNPGQFGASRGFAVFYPNYRGSTGRGLEFSKLSQKDPAGKEFDDIVDGVDHLIGIGLVDRAKVGVTGGSYGGYATGWLSTSTASASRRA
jgi:dipeptidyl aminopeptidase/acylaminoacyl peptidase